MIDKLLPYGYIFKFGNKRIYDPNGPIEEPLTDEDITNHNKKLAQIEVENALKTGRAVFYIGYTQNPDDAYPWIKQYHVGTWDGSYRWNAYVKTSWHNFAGKDGRRDCWFNINGQRWHGVNIGNSDMVHAKRVKSRGDC